MAIPDPETIPRPLGPSDIGLMRALESPDGVRPTAVELLARAERWRPWRAYAASHLWAADPKNPSESKHAKAA